MKLLLGNDDDVVAPAGPRSGVSHPVTWERGVWLEARGTDRFAMHGTPAACTRLGLLRVAFDAKWVLSGIKHGGNLGTDVHYSGTVSVVREAVLHVWPGIALSRYLRDDTEPGVIFCPLDPHPLPLCDRHEENGHHFHDGNYNSRQRTLGAAVDTCFAASIAVTAIRLY